MLSRFTIYSATILYIVFNRDVNCLVRRRFFHDGMLYEDYSPDSENLRYSLTGEGWNNLDELITSRNLTRKAMFCSQGLGVWLLYPAENFGYGANSRELQLVNGENCQPIDRINSIQPLGPLNFKFAESNSVIGFTEKYFASPAKVLGNDSQSVKSLIFMGNGKWTVRGGDKPICVTTSESSEYTCLVEDAETAFSASITITPGCDEAAEMEEYGLQTCYTTGFHRIQYEFDFALPNMQKVCSGDYDSGDDVKDKFLKVYDVLYRRIHNNFQADDIDEEKTNETRTLKAFNIWRFGVVANLATILHTSCTSVDTEYVQILAYVFVNMHLMETPRWTEPPENSSRTDDDLADLQRTFYYLKSCAAQAMSGPKYSTGCTPLSISAMKTDQEINTIEDFLTSDSNDLIIEQMWLIMSYANAYCSALMGYVDNHWIELPFVIKRELMYPVRKQWKNPGRWATYYPVMFHGWDLNEERKQLIGCLQQAIIQTPLYDPLSRPPEFYEHVNTTALRDEAGQMPSSSKKEQNGDADADNQNRRKRQGLDSDETQLISENKFDSKATASVSTTSTTPATTSSSLGQSSTSNPTLASGPIPADVPTEADTPGNKRVAKKTGKKGKKNKHAKKNKEKRKGGKKSAKQDKEDDKIHESKTVDASAQ